MIIRKLYKFEGAHIVRDCSSERCSKSVHGHSYIVEVFLTSDKLDNGNMIMDFGLMKGNINTLIDSFDHALSIWNKESLSYKDDQKQWSDRYIIMPVSPSAEQYSLMFLFIIDKIIKNTVFNNGEGKVEVHSVRVHETTTGYAEAFQEDLKWVNYDLEDIIFSDGIKEEWKDQLWWKNLQKEIKFVNPVMTPKYS